MAAIHSNEFKRNAVRIALTSGLTRRQVAADLRIGLSTLGKWVRAVSEEAKVLAQYAEPLTGPANSFGARDLGQPIPDHPLGLRAQIGGTGARTGAAWI